MLPLTQANPGHSHPTCLKLLLARVLPLIVVWLLEPSEAPTEEACPDSRAFAPEPEEADFYLSNMSVVYYSSPAHFWVEETMRKDNHFMSSKNTKSRMSTGSGKRNVVYKDTTGCYFK